jgi:uncharacterized protein
VLGNWFVPREFWLSWHHQTYGLVNLAYLTNTLVVIVGVVMIAGRRRPAEIGLELRKLPAAVLYTCLVWLVLQLVMAAWYWASGKPIRIASEWSGSDRLHNLGTFIGHFFGNAMNEEVVYRGFILVQFALLFHRHWPRHRRMAFVVALLAETAIFCAMHVPDRMVRNTYISLLAVSRDQFILFVNGCVYALIYWRTGNLFFAVGVHTLWNHPTTLFAWHDFGPLTVPGPIVLGLGAAIAVRRYRSFDRRPQKSV